MTSAIELELFVHLAAGKRTVTELAAACGGSERGVRGLLDALTGLGYLQKSKTQFYRLSPLASTFLVPGKQLYMGGLAPVGKLMAMAWTTLTEAVRKGESVSGGRSPEEATQFFTHLTPAIFALNFVAAQAAAKRLRPQLRRIKRILDIGAGAAPWSIPFAQAIKGSRVTVIDYPGVIPVTREFASKCGVADRYEYREGDYHEVDFGVGDFDLAILGHIVHSERPANAKELITRIERALRARGRLLIGEFVPNDERSAPATPLLFGLNMLINTAHGDVYTMLEYRAWLREAGFTKVEELAAPAVSPLIVATK